jgi:hypothetical protein
LTLSQFDSIERKKWILIQEKSFYKIQSDYNKKFLTINKDIDLLEIKLEDESQSLSQEWLFVELKKNHFVIISRFDKNICLAVEKRNDISKIVLASFQNSLDRAIRKKTWFIEEISIPKTIQPTITTGPSNSSKSKNNLKKTLYFNN